MPPFVASIDQGTTSSRFIVFDKHGAVVAFHQQEFPSIYPQAGWCEQDPLVIWESVKQCISETIKKFIALGHSPKDIASIGITNQRETTIVWDRITGEPLHHALVWLDTRTSETVLDLIANTPSKNKDAFRVGVP